MKKIPPNLTPLDKEAGNCEEVTEENSDIVVFFVGVDSWGQEEVGLTKVLLCLW